MGLLAMPFNMLWALIKPCAQIAIFLITRITWIAIPIALLSLLINLAKKSTSRDEFAELLIPYHNDYFLFQEYYLTVPSLNNY